MTRFLLRNVSRLALAVTIAPALLFAGGVIDLDQTKGAMLVGTLVWFIVTPIWMDRGDTTPEAVGPSTEMP
jgi:hypothetical protein